MSDRSAGLGPARVVAVLGPTNTGKTHLAVERMLGHASGMIGLPLRLLAREIYDRIVKARGPRAVALITGEEKIVPPRATYFVCTVEAMPLSMEVEFLAIDEVQLCADPTRGHIFTQRLLHARGTRETMFLGAGTAGPLIRRLLPRCEIETRERFSALTYAGSKKLTRLPRRSAIVAFSAENVYAIAELIRRQRGGAAVVMGSLSPRTRNAQVALYQNGEVDFLVATDAIGMGLNMDVDHVAFAGLRKFDGKKTRWLTPQEIGQIAGRAGRFKKDGTFGVTGDAPEIDEDQVSAVEEHRFEPLDAANWRNDRLDFASLAALQRSLALPPNEPGLKLAAEAVDELTLRHLANDPDIAERARDKARLHKLWEVCQTPDFRKTTLDEHLRLAKTLFEHLSIGTAGRLPADWMAEQYRAVDRTEGEIDVLAQRLAGVRTLAYVCNRPDWLSDAAHWQGRTRELEERLSDTLHAKLMQRFIDRRTSALLRGLNLRDDTLAGVGHDGEVTVEGHPVGRLEGARFTLAEGASPLEHRALVQAAQRVVAPLVAKKLGELAADADEGFSMDDTGLVRWRGAEAGQLIGGAPFAPRVRLFGELGPEAVRERAQRRLEAWVAARSTRVLHPLARLKTAVADGSIKGLSRGIAYRLLEAGGVMDRAGSAAEVASLSQAERRGLRAAGVRFGAFSLFCPALLVADARAHLAAFARLEPAGSARRLSALGLRAVAGVTLPVEALERFDDAMRQAPHEHGCFRLTEEITGTLEAPPGHAIAVLKALGFTRAGKPPAEGEPPLWRRRNPPTPAPGAESVPSPRTDSPFHALAAISFQPAVKPKPDSSAKQRSESGASPARKPRRRRHLPPSPGLSGLFSSESGEPSTPTPESAPAPRRRRRRPKRAGPPAAAS